MRHCRKPTRCQDLPDLNLHLKRFSSLDSPRLHSQSQAGTVFREAEVPLQECSTERIFAFDSHVWDQTEAEEHSCLSSEKAQSTCLSGTPSLKGQGSCLSQYEKGEAATGSSRLHCSSGYCWGKGSQKERKSLVMSWFRLLSISSMSWNMGDSHVMNLLRLPMMSKGAWNE